jgi:outer membrane cobalamin receptor
LTAGLVVCLWLLIAIPGRIEAQSTVKIDGYIYDAADGYAIGGAVIRIQESNFAVFSDQLGRFMLEHIPEGRYRLEVSVAGYKLFTDDIEVVPDVTTRLTVTLERDVYDMGEREVSGHALPMRVYEPEIIDRQAIEQSGAGTLAEVIDRLGGVYIHDSGPVGGNQLVSIRGNATKHTLILVDGLRINRPGSGEADLSDIPLETIEKVEIYKGGQSSRYGPDALGGVINIITQDTGSRDNPELKAHKYWGKWKTDLRDIILADPIQRQGLTTKLTYGYRGTNGDFGYRYSPQPSHAVERIYEGIRYNADFESRNYFASCRYHPSEKTSVNISGQYYRSRQGLPGKASRPDTSARKEDRRILGNLRFMHEFSGAYHLESSIRFSRYSQNFDNPASLAAYESRYTNDISEWEAVNRLRPWIGNEFTGGVSLQHDILYHDDLLNPAAGMGRAVRDNAGIFAADRQAVSLDRVPFWDMAAIDVSVRWDNTKTNKDNGPDLDESMHKNSNWSQKAGFSISGGSRVRLMIRGNYGTSYRLPSINALFWKSDVRSEGNPDLRPERAEHSEAGFELSSEGKIKIAAGITYFHNYVRDIIVWRPGSPSGVWRPENLDAALITGHEDFIRISLFDDRVRLTYNNTITVPKNKSASSVNYDKYLTFRPHYITGIGCDAKYWKFRGGYHIRMVDIRYALEANTKWYSVYRVDDASLGFGTEISHLAIEADYKVKNLRGEHYELMAHYPMPGREWGVGISISYKVE